MRIFIFLVFLVVIASCTPREGSHNFSAVQIETLYTDSISIRAIELMPGSLAFAANKGIFGSVDLQSGEVRTNTQLYDTITPAFRSVAHTATDFFMLSVGNPALLYKTGDQGHMELVYTEEGEGVFYDSMTFWNNREGIALGDSREGCLSILITRDGGAHWKKTSCSELPAAPEGEGAFAASNTNIEVVGDMTYLVTTSSTIYISEDKGASWKVVKTPIVADAPTQGIYSIDFYNTDLGVAFGGDYTDPGNAKANKAITRDGGRTWQLLADGETPGYKSCVQFVPHSGGNDIVALGFTGISYSKDMGRTWTTLSEESFYTLRFLNDSVAYAAGRNRIAKLTFN